jgi:hypothetical protein
MGNYERALSPGVAALSAPDWGQIVAWKLCQTGAPATVGKGGSGSPGILAPVGNFLLLNYAGNGEEK